MEQVVDELWPDRPYDEKVKRLYRKAIGAIQDVLEEHGLSEAFVNKRGSCHVEREKIECDTSKPQYIETIWGVGYRFKV